MIKPRIFVTGATGKTGGAVASELLNAGYRVRALVHKEDGRRARLREQGAEMAIADMSDVERLVDALKDVQSAYFCPPFDPYMIQGAVAFAVAAKAARLEHIVGLTQWLATDVLAVTGRPPEDFETIARRYAALPRNQRTVANRFRQLAQLMVAPFRRGFDFETYDRELRRPFPSQPQFARESTVWQREHLAAVADRPRGARPVSVAG